ncbi:MAG: hypothetical protein MUQ56_06490, partial [Thermoleophilia bacterium]|nr:hypothetical protein [Thermoleophilia bacterium]
MGVIVGGCIPVPPPLRGRATFCKKCDVRGYFHYVKYANVRKGERGGDFDADRNSSGSGTTVCGVECSRGRLERPDHAHDACPEQHDGRQQVSQ